MEATAATLVHDPTGGDDALHRKLVWLTLFRLATVTVLLGGTAVVNWQFGIQAALTVAPLYAVVAATWRSGSAMLARRAPPDDRAT